MASEVGASSAGGSSRLSNISVVVVPPDVLEEIDGLRFRAFAAFPSTTHVSSLTLIKSLVESLFC